MIIDHKGTYMAEDVHSEEQDYSSGQGQSATAKAKKEQYRSSGGIKKEQIYHEGPTELVSRDC